MSNGTWREDGPPGEGHEAGGNGDGIAPSSPATDERASARTIRDDVEPRPEAPDGPSLAATVRDGSGGPGEQASGSLLRLPGALSAWRIEREVSSRGAEADLLLVSDGSDQLRVAKIYRQGIEPKTSVLERVGGSSFEHVVRLYDHGQSDGRWYELLEYIENGSLEELIASEGPRLSDERVRAVVQELAAAIEHLHECDVVHRDIKPSNILVRTLAPFDLVLADFGIASVMGEASKRFTSAHRTIAYAAPETAAGEISSHADWWSLGIILVEMLVGHHPFSAANSRDFLDDRTIMSRLFQMPVDDLVEGVSDSWRALCRGLLRRDARTRWGASEVERWLAGDTALSVAIEAAPAQPDHTPFFFAGENYLTLFEIATAYKQNWGEARKSVGRGHLEEWVRSDLKNNEWVQFLADLDHDCESVDEKVFRIIMKANKGEIPVFCGYKLDPDGLIAIAQKALSGGESGEQLDLIYDRELLWKAARSTGVESFSLLQRQWTQSVKEYQSKYQAAISAGAPQQKTSQSKLKARLLLCILPGGEAYMESLREEVIGKRTEALLEGHEVGGSKVQWYTSSDTQVPWYTALGTANTTSAPTLMLLIEFRDAAKAHFQKLERKREEEFQEAKRQREQEKRAAIATSREKTGRLVKELLIYGSPGAIFGWFAWLAASTSNPFIQAPYMLTLIGLMGLGWAMGSFIGFIVALVIVSFIFSITNSVVSANQKWLGTAVHGNFDAAAFADIAVFGLFGLVVGLVIFAIKESKRA